MANLNSFPYPVLGHEDDLSGEFSFELEYTLQPLEVLLDIRFQLQL